MRAGITARYLNRWIYIAEATKRKGRKWKKNKGGRKLTNELQSIWDGIHSLYVEREKEFAAPRRKRDDADLRFAFT